MSTPGAAPDRVLSTLNEDGSRFWIHPRLAKGRFWKRRAAVAYGLIALFVALPMIHINGKPAILLDILTREFTLLGTTFRPSDTFLLLLFGIATLLGVFFITALLGRIWCGWGCPQTVYLEYVFRPIERWLEGPPAQRHKLDQSRPNARRLLKWGIYAVLAVALANVFLSYFVGWERLARWMTQNPAAHPVGFGTVVFVSALMFLDFGYLREQVCIVACPYGRLQSVLVDTNSLIIGYDARRGEPRGKKKKLPVVDASRLVTVSAQAELTAKAGHPASGADTATTTSSASAAQAATATSFGDCVDCGACVNVCPTGIDIRAGLQMECIGCAQCIDACDEVMDKLKRPRGLIRYSSQEQLAGRPRKVLRPRILLYPLGIALVGGLFVTKLGGRAETDVWVVRSQEVTYQQLPGGNIASPARVKIENKSPAKQTYHVSLLSPSGLRLMAPTAPLPLQPGAATTLPVFIEVPVSSFVHGKIAAKLRIDNGADFQREVDVTLFGPTQEGAP